MSTVLILFLVAMVAVVGLWSWAMCRAPEAHSWPFGECRSCDRSAAPDALAEPHRVIVRGSSAAGAVFGVLGALLLAMPAMPGWGFGAFIVSNLAWIIASHLRRQAALHLQQWVFLVCSLIGFWNWWLGPLVLG